MVKQTQTIRQQFAYELFECDHLVGLALKGLKYEKNEYLMNRTELFHEIRTP